MTTTREEYFERVHDEEWRTFSRCAFHLARFAPYDCIATPDLETGLVVTSPIRGDKSLDNLNSVIPNGWDHEHCDVCYGRILPGERYWTNKGFEHVDLCEDCYPLVRAELLRRDLG